MQLSPAVLGIEGLRVELYDAHCGRGYFTNGTQIVEDRSVVSIPASEFAQASYTGAPSDGDYDEVHFTLHSADESTEKRKVRIEVRGENAAHMDDRLRENWTKVDNQCVKVP